MLVKLSWIHQNKKFSKILMLVSEEDEKLYYDGESLTETLIDEFKKDGYLVLIDVEDGMFYFLHVNMIKSMTQI